MMMTNILEFQPDRAIWLGFGIVIGLYLSHMHDAIKHAERLSHKAKREAHQTRKKLDLLMNQDHRTERGAVDVNRLVVGVVVIMTALAAILTGMAYSKASRSAEDSGRALRQNARIVHCNQTILFHTVGALNQRTQYTVAQADANVKLQKAQVNFLRIVLSPPKPPRTTDPGRDALKEYFKALTKYVVIVGKSNSKIKQNPYPTQKQFTDCIRGDE